MLRKRRRRTGPIGFAFRWYRRTRLVLMAAGIAAVAVQWWRGRSGGSADERGAGPSGGDDGSGHRAPIGGPRSPSFQAAAPLPEPDPEPVGATTPTRHLSSVPTSAAAGDAVALAAVPDLDDAGGADAAVDTVGSAEATTWVAPLEGGSCPLSHPVKANANSGIFHVPGGRFYDRTAAERCYATPDDATADGFRQAKQ